MTFGELGVPDALVNVLTGQGITHPFPIQQATMVDDCLAYDETLRANGGII